MTEKYLVELDIENPYFYGCEKPLKKEISIFERKLKNKKCASLYFANIKRCRFLFFKFPLGNRDLFFLMVPIFVNELTYFL